jgi:hypothetical protein
MSCIQIKKIYNKIRGYYVFLIVIFVIIASDLAKTAYFILVHDIERKGEHFA